MGLGELGIIEFRPGSEAELGSDDGASAREAVDSNLVCCCFCRASPIPTYPRLAGAGSTFGSVPPCFSLPLALHSASVILAVLTEATWNQSPVVLWEEGTE